MMSADSYVVCMWAYGKLEGGGGGEGRRRRMEGAETGEAISN